MLRQLGLKRMVEKYWPKTCTVWQNFRWTMLFWLKECFLQISLDVVKKIGVLWTLTWYLFVLFVALQAYRLNRASAELARKAADDVTAQTGWLHFDFYTLLIIVQLFCHFCSNEAWHLKKVLDCCCYRRNPCWFLTCFTSDWLSLSACFSTREKNY